MTVKHHSLRHFTDSHYKAIDEAKSYEELKEVALDILKSMQQPIAEVCGPISSGGSGDIQKNSEKFEKVIHKLSDSGHNIFNQMPFQEAMGRIKKNVGTHEKEKNQMLLEGFYYHIFKSGLIKKFYFIHGWESSHGANWEREMAKDLGIEVVDLPKDFLEK